MSDIWGSTVQCNLTKFELRKLGKKRRHTQGSTQTFFFRSTRAPKLKNLGAQEKKMGAQ